MVLAWTVYRNTPAGAFFVYNLPKWKSEPMEDHSELMERMRKYATFCNELKKTELRRGLDVIKKEIGPALREGAEALRSERVWSSTRKKNGDLQG